MGSYPKFKRPVGKKLVIACDGTWMNGDQGFDTSPFAPPTAQIPTNVTRIVRAIKHEDEAGVPQIVFYQRGVGANGDEEDKLVGGLTGMGLSEHVREAYGFLANNFNPSSQSDLDDSSKPMDEIVILGFSRGAFTARAIASLVSDIGLLTREGMENFWGIFGDWMKQNIQGRQSEWFERQYGKKAAFTDPSYKDALIKNGLTRWPMPIRAIGVWDTVGSLGIPLPWDAENVKAFSFVNTKVAKHVQHAFHALALDEHRHLYSPTLWEQPGEGSELKVLRQCWFPGVHSNIGGSYPDAGIANITLLWMISQLEDHDGGILSFDPNYLDWLQDLSIKYYVEAKESIRPWGFGELYDSAPKNTLNGVLQGLSPMIRTPGRYHEINDENGQQTNVRLDNTNESIHYCVRVRVIDRGPDAEEDSLMKSAEKFVGLNTGEYNSAALRNYELVESEQGGAYWRAKDGLEGLPEDTLGSTELRLLKRYEQGRV